MSFLSFYRGLTGLSGPIARAVLQRRLQAGKEHPERVGERTGRPSLARPEGKLFWVHAASVGEVQSSLILIDRLLARFLDAHVLITTGTMGSVAFLEGKLPKRAVHQFYPLDHPRWVARFLDHWQPDFVLWMESELWPNMLCAVKARGISAVLLNARLSERSAKRWGYFKRSAKTVLQSFTLILTQTKADQAAYKALGHGSVKVSGNIKYSAAPLRCDASDLMAFEEAVSGRSMWVYASTHAGEEALACDVHQQLKKRIPGLLTVIVPRHVERRGDIQQVCDEAELESMLRGGDKALPHAKTDIYIADTMGELGLFYQAAPLAVIGRSFSDDGGGGHNPIEAAQLGAAVLSGPHVQYQQEIFDDMVAAGAAQIVGDAGTLDDVIGTLLSDKKALKSFQKAGRDFVARKSAVIDDVENKILPLITKVMG